jgi:YEATS domain-containing protein 4
MTSAADASKQPSSVALGSLQAEPSWTGGDMCGNSRLSDTTACLPIVYGSVAVYLGKKADEFSTHKWSLYLRGPNDEDISYCIAKVIFQLHPSFAQPIRELVSPPFEVTERGWGEYESFGKIQMRNQLWYVPLNLFV